jgi:hypothetical protein
MAERRIIFAYCSEGPYRHLTRTLASGTTWIPWGYRSSQFAPETAQSLRHGEIGELWEVDNTRHPQNARLAAVVRLDFFTRAGDYVPLTLTVENLPSLATEAAVLKAVGAGHLVSDYGGGADCEVKGQLRTSPTPKRKAL